MNKKKKPDSLDVGKRIDDTKKQIAQLSEELQKLINSNVNKGILTDEFGKTVKKEDHAANTLVNIALNKSNTKDINFNVGTSIKNSSCTSVVPSTFRDTDVVAKTDQCKQRTKAYKQEEAKEYIKKQREKREEQRKQINSKTKIDQELKKQKLYELQQKTSAIVQRNVQLKRERSRSRENRGQIRIDRNFTSIGRPNFNDKQPFNNTHIEKKLSPVPKPSPQQLATKLDIDNHCRIENLQKNNIRTNDEVFRNITFRSSIYQAPSSVLNEPDLNHATEQLLPAKRKAIKYCKMNKPQNNNIGANRNAFCNINMLARNGKTYYSSALSKPDLDYAATKIQAFFRGYCARKEMKNKLTTKSDHCMMTENCAKESKETQTNIQEKENPPSWLQLPPVEPYPCNFINTVRRKLQLVVNSPALSRDVGIQSSIIENFKPEVPKTEQNEQIAVNSYNEKHTSTQNPQECKNLDVDALQHLALIPSGNKTVAGASKRSKTDSESDTSKNIPEISTESGSTSATKNRFESITEKDNKFLVINTDKIKNLHLRPQEGNKACSGNKIISEDKTMSKKSYTFSFFDPKADDSDISFNEETDDSQNKKFLRSPRDSIISFNRSQNDYFVPSPINQNNVCLEIASNDEIKTENENSGIAFLSSSTSSNKKSEKSKERHASSSKQQFHQNDDTDNENPNSIPRSGKSPKYDKISPLELIENIENSINTSLVSHISDKSESSHTSSHKSHYSSNIKSGAKYSFTENSKSRSKISENSSKPVSAYSQSCDQTDQKQSEPSLNSSKPKTVSSDTRIGVIQESEKLPVFVSNSNSTAEKNSKSDSMKTMSMPSVSDKSKWCSSGRSQSSLKPSNQKSSDKSKQKDTSKSNESYSSHFSLEKLTDDTVTSKNLSQEEISTESEQSIATNTDNLREKNSSIDRRIEKIKLNNINITHRNKRHTPHVKDINSRVVHTKVDKNEIHLKFEAEVHLLNDFNESLKQFMAVEKAFKTIKNKNESNSRNTSKNSAKLTFSADSKIASDLSKSIISSINVSRGDYTDDSQLLEELSVKKPLKPVEQSSGLEISNIEPSVNNEEFVNSSSENIPNNLAGLSINMFEQLIKDEDARIENLKTIIKIREQALLDRTKGELAWLEIQRKHLYETGKLQEASLVKKKQRGILLKHQQERREMQRLKQLQKIKSNERKTILKEQKNLIKLKLTSENIMSDLKIKTPRKKRSSGPMKVLKSSESVHSETSISLRGSEREEILSITSRSRSLRLSEGSSNSNLVFNEDETNIRIPEKKQDISNLKTALLHRQGALMKRRKAVEDLLQKHQKLLEEEKKINDLEMVANALIMHMPTVQNIPSSTNISKINCNQLNELGQKIGIFKDNRLLDEKSYCLSYENLYNEAESYIQTRQKSSHISTDRDDKSSQDKTNNQIQSISTNDTKTPTPESIQTETVASKVSHDSPKENSVQYSADFEVDTQNNESRVFTAQDPDESNLSSINELIQDFSKIEHGISMLSKQFEKCQSTEDSVNQSIGTENISELISEPSKLERDNVLPEILEIIDQTLESNEKSPVEHEKLNNSEVGTDTTNIDELVSIKDEDVSAMIHAMAPSTDSENSLNLELQTEDKSPRLSNTMITDQIETEDVLSNENNFEDKSSDILSDELSLNAEPVQDHQKKSMNYEENEVHESVSNSEQIVDVPSDTESTKSQLIEKLDERSICDKTPSTEELAPKQVSLTQNTSEFSEVTEIKTDTGGGIVPYIEDSVTSKQENIESKDRYSQSKQNNNIIISENSKLEEVSNDSLSSDVAETVNSDYSNRTSINQVDKISSVCEDKTSQGQSESSISDDNSDEIHELREDYILSSPKETPSSPTPSITSSNLLSAKDTEEEIKSKDSNSDTNSSETNSELSELKNSLDIGTNASEKFSSENILASEELQGDSTSDNYSDDFEDDKEADTLLEVQINTNLMDADKKSLSDQEEPDSIECDNEKSKKKEEVRCTDNEIVMAQIELLGFNSESEAKISVIEQNERNDENISDTNTISNSTTINEYINEEPEIIQEEIEDDVKSEMLSKPNTLDVHQRVSEILANTIDSQKNLKEKRVHDYYVTTYEDITPTNSPESAPSAKTTQSTCMNIFGNEAEELLKKQLAIEQEIKHLEQQQKEQLPYLYMREIPNKPPPPYTPPTSINPVITVLPSKVEDLKEICNYSAKVLYNAYLSNNLSAVTFSEIHFKSINKAESCKECCLFVFDLCREVAKAHYKKFEKENIPTWLKVPEESRLVYGKPFDYGQLEKHINSKVKDYLGFEKPNIKENAIIKWCRRKKDHVDEILVLESQAEEHEWLNHDKDELIVKNIVTNEIFDILLNDTVAVFRKIFS